MTELIIGPPCIFFR